MECSALPYTYCENAMLPFADWRGRLQKSFSLVAVGQPRTREHSLHGNPSRFDASTRVWHLSVIEELLSPSEDTLYTVCCVSVEHHSAAGRIARYDSIAASASGPATRIQVRRGVSAGDNQPRQASAPASATEEADVGAVQSLPALREAVF